MSLRTVPLVAALVTGAVVIVASLSACPPPPKPPHDAGPPPDSGVAGQAGDPCFSSTFTNDCDLGLVCSQLIDADAGVFGCATEGDVDAGCFFVNSNDGEPAPPNDGCKNGLVCGSSGSCATEGVLGTPCASPADCLSLNCGNLADGSAKVCVVNECTAGCVDGEVCAISQCGLTCVGAPGNGEACFTPAVDACGSTSLTCADGLQCYVGDPATGVTCASPGGRGAHCNLATTQQGCGTNDFCDPASSTCQPTNP